MVGSLEGLPFIGKKLKKIVNGFHYLRGALFLPEINNVTHSCLTLSHRNPGRTLYDKVSVYLGYTLAAIFHLD